MNWAQAKVAEYLEASMWLAPVGDKLTKEFNIDKYNPKNKNNWVSSNRKSNRIYGEYISFRAFKYWIYYWIIR